MNKNFLKVVFSELVRVGTLPLRLLPIKKNRILFTGLTGGNSYDYSCNPKYLYEYLRDNCPGQYEYVWVVSDKAKYSFLEEEGVKLCKHFTVSSFPMLLTSKIIVTNGSYAAAPVDVPAPESWPGAPGRRCCGSRWPGPVRRTPARPPPPPGW